MSVKTVWMVASLLAAVPACATDSGDPEDTGYDADPGDFDSKADGVAATSRPCSN